MSYNSGTYQGRLTADVEMKPVGQTVKAEFSVACTRSYKNGDEYKTDFIPCEAWRGTAEFIARYFQKGSPITVTGPLEIETYEDGDGNKRRSVRVKVEHAYFVDGAGKSDASGKGGNKPTQAADPDESEEMEDENGDLPF